MLPKRSRKADYLLAGLGLVLLLASPGCGRSFDPYWKINKFRVLAVKASTPQLGPGQTAEFSALVWAPAGDVEYSWEWCPFRTTGGGAYKCPVTREELIESIRENAPEGTVLPDAAIDQLLPPFDLGNDPTAALAYPASPQLVLALCRSLQQVLADAPSELAGLLPSVDCRRGVDVSIRLVARSGGSEIVAGKRLNLQTDPDATLNQNPDIETIQIRPWIKSTPAHRTRGLDWVPASDTPDEQRWYALPEDEVTPILAGAKYEIRAVVDPDSIDLWRPPTPLGSDLVEMPLESEALLFRWMATAGEIDDSRRVYAEDLISLEDASLTEFRIRADDDSDRDNDGIQNAADPCPLVPKDGVRADEASEGDCRLRVWSIARDGRLGLGWVERHLEVVGALENPD